MADAHPIPDRHGANLYTGDPTLAALLPLYLDAPLLAHLQPHLHDMGALAGGVLDELALVADKHPPELEHRNRRGEDAQRIVKHPAYVEMERIAFGRFGLAAMAHRGGVLGWPEPMPPAAKYALTYLFVQAEFGLCCPLSMTDALSRTLRRYGDGDLVRRHIGTLLSQDLDGLTQGAMFMTEQAGGSDVGATETRAEPAGDAYRLHGDKWFCSNPDAGYALVLARIDGAADGLKGLSLFLLPRRLPDGRANAYRILRLKDKLGTRSMASGEIRLEGATAWLVGDPDQGFRQMADMINHSRLSNGMRAAGLMRRAYTEALHVARERRAFGAPLVDQPLMRRQLAKLLLPAEQARTMTLQCAQALAQADAGSAAAQALIRILTPLLKFRACRDARRVTGDAMEVRGGCGYIEEWSDPRLVRDAHLGSIWEGTSNIVALDVIRAARREAALPPLTAHLEGLLDGAGLDDTAVAPFRQALQASAALVRRVADARGTLDGAARQAASALYHAATAAMMAWEAGRIGSARRLALARAVLRHRLQPRDPLALDDEDVPTGLLLDDHA